MQAAESGRPGGQATTGQTWGGARLGLARGLGYPQRHKAKLLLHMRLAQRNQWGGQRHWFAKQTRKGILGTNSVLCPSPSQESRPEIPQGPASCPLPPLPTHTRREQGIHPLPPGASPALLSLPRTLGACSGGRRPLGGDTGFGSACVAFMPYQGHCRRMLQTWLECQKCPLGS